MQLFRAPSVHLILHARQLPGLERRRVVAQRLPGLVPDARRSVEPHAERGAMSGQRRDCRGVGGRTGHGGRVRVIREAWVALVNHAVTDDEAAPASAAPRGGDPMVLGQVETAKDVRLRGKTDAPPGKSEMLIEGLCDTVELVPRYRDDVVILSIR